jgi:hypothetical protein
MGNLAPQKYLGLAFKLKDNAFVGSKHITMTPFGMSHCITFQRCGCLNVSHLELLKDFHNIFVYYVRI